MLLDFSFLLNFITQEINKSFVSFGVQRAAATAAGAGPARTQEARPLLGTCAHAEQPEGPGAELGRRLQELPEWRSRSHGAEAGNGGAQYTGHAA